MADMVSQAMHRMEQMVTEMMTKRDK